MAAPTDKLRLFTDLDDLFDNNSDEQILRWVNSYAKVAEQRRISSKRYLTRGRILMQVAKEQLDADELERVEQMVQERLEGGGK